jgi:dihydrofolate reductase
VVTISLIVALDRNRLIGSGNALPWHLPADLAYFRKTTLGKPVIMGRRTHASIGRPLPGRDNIVVSRDPALRAAGCTVVASIDAALAAAGAADEVLVIGGASFYAQLLPRATRLYLTWIDAEFAGDAWFPEIDPADWRVMRSEAHAADEHNPYAYRFEVLERVAR